MDGETREQPSERLDVSRFALLALIAGLCIAATIAIVVILGDAELGETGARALSTALALMIFSLCGLAGSSLGRARAELAWLGTAAVVLAAAGFAVVAGAIWLEGDWADDAPWQVAGVAIAVSLGLSYCCLLLRRDPGHEGATGAIRTTTVLMTGLLTMLVIIEVLGDDEEIGPRALGVLAVLVVLGSILLPLVRALQRPADDR